MIRNLVFDIGNVLADYHIMEFLAARGFDRETSKRIVKASVMSPWWETFERGEISEEDVMREFVRLDPGIEKELYAAYQNIAGMLTPRDYAVPLVRALRTAGYGVYYLSNYSKKAHDECPETLRFAEYTCGGLLSFESGMTKPDPAFYRLFLKRFALDPKECAFIDDTPENVAAAEALGFTGIVFTDLDALTRRLAELGVTFAL